MSFKLDRVHVWSGEVADQAGGVAAKLAVLAQSNTNLEYISTHRLSDRPGTGLLYVAPVTGSAAVKAAKAAGLHEANHPIVLRVEGDNAAGLAHRLTQQWAVEGLSLHGLTMSVLGDKFVGYVSFDSVADANRAAAILGDLGSAAGAEAREQKNQHHH
ncbi:MAG: amino acid-binding ACT [Gemmataceae bacterium]